MYLLIINLIDSIFRSGKNYYTQVFLEECNIVKEKNMSEYFTDKIEVSSDDSDIEDSDEEISNEENSYKESSSEEKYSLF